MARPPYENFEYMSTKLVRHFFHAIVNLLDRIGSGIDRLQCEAVIFHKMRVGLLGLSAPSDDRMGQTVMKKVTPNR
jgi:hypothetical protein